MLRCQPVKLATGCPIAGLGKEEGGRRKHASGDVKQAPRERLPGDDDDVKDGRKQVKDGDTGPAEPSRFPPSAERRDVADPKPAKVGTAKLYLRDRKAEFDTMQRLGSPTPSRGFAPGNGGPYPKVDSGTNAGGNVALSKVN